MDPNYKLRPLSTSEQKIKDRIIEYLYSKKYVFVLGPKGIGKTPIILTALNEIKTKKYINYYRFDMREQDIQIRAHDFYESILETIADTPIMIDRDKNPSDEFIDKLNKHVKSPVILFFDSFRALNQDFHEHFTDDCRKIYHEGFNNPGSGLSKILMVFGGSMLNHSDYKTTSPLWNICERIEVLPILEHDTKDIIIREFNKKRLQYSYPKYINSLDNFAKGHPSLSMSLKTFSDERKQFLKIEDYQDVIEAFIDYIFDLFNKKTDVNTRQDKLRNHFIKMVEYIESSPEIFEMVLDIQTGKSVQGSPLPAIDEFTITGFLTKDHEGFYDFSNDVYKAFFNHFLQDYRIADFCVLHSQDEEFWKKAKKTYNSIRLQGKNRTNDYELSPGTKKFSHLAEKLIKRLELCLNTDDIVKELEEILYLVFGISFWSIYFINNQEHKSGGIDPHFTGDYPKRTTVPEDQIKYLDQFIQKALINRTPLFDWTGTWIALPLFIRGDTERIFIGKLTTGHEKINIPLISFIRGALTVYFYQISKEKVQHELEQVKILSIVSIERHYDLKNAEKKHRFFERMFSSIQDFMYLVDKNYNVILMNDKIKELVKKIDIPQDTKCYNALMERKTPCKACPVANVFQTKEHSHIVRNIKKSGKNLVLDCTFVPIKDDKGDQIIGVSISMHDLRDRQLLWQALQDMEKIEDIKEMEEYVLKALSEFGFKRVFQYGYKKDKKIFVSENFIGQIKNYERGEEFRTGKVKIEPKDLIVQAGNVSVWYRRNTTRKRLKAFLENRLQNTDFELKATHSWPEHDLTRKTRGPDFWVSVPLMGKNGIVKLYAMGNAGDNELDKKLISLDKLQALQTFAWGAGQILENMQKRRYSYLDRLQAMLAHSTIEPLQLTRMLLHKLVNIDNLKERKNLVEISDATLSRAQSSLRSLIVLEKGPDSVNIKKVNINEILEELSGIFRAYTQTINIKFVIIHSFNEIFFPTDPKILSLILNNIIGNAIRYLQNLKKESKIIQMKAVENDHELTIEISDNGPGLPQEVIKYLNPPFNKDKPYPAGGFGIGFSRAMANMLGGDLTILENSFNSGTKFNLIIGGKFHDKI